MKDLFSEFESRPIKRKALRIQTEHALKYFEGKSEAQVTTKLGILTFKCYEEPNVGDYICYVTPTDIYHCNVKVFSERNLV